MGRGVGSRAHTRRSVSRQAPLAAYVRPWAGLWAWGQGGAWGQRPGALRGVADTKRSTSTPWLTQPTRVSRANSSSRGVAGPRTRRACRTRRASGCARARRHEHGRLVRKRDGRVALRREQAVLGLAPEPVAHPMRFFTHVRMVFTSKPQPRTMACAGSMKASASRARRPSGWPGSAGPGSPPGTCRGRGWRPGASGPPRAS